MGDLGKDLEAVEAELLEHWNETAPLEPCDLLFEVAEAAEHGGEHG